MTEKLTLKHPIPTGEDAGITSVSVGPPRLIDIQKLLLAVGSQTIHALMDHFGDNAKKAPTADPEAKDQKADAPDNKSVASSLDRKILTQLMGDLIRQDRFDAFNDALGSYLNLKADHAAKLSIPDLIAIGGKAMDFFPEVASMLAEPEKDDETV